MTLLLIYLAGYFLSGTIFVRCFDADGLDASFFAFIWPISLPLILIGVGGAAIFDWISDL